MEEESERGIDGGREDSRKKEREGGSRERGREGGTSLRYCRFLVVQSQACNKEETDADHLYYDTESLNRNYTIKSDHH